MILNFTDGVLQNPSTWLKGTVNLNGRFDVQVKKLSRRSIPQNRYYFGVIVQMIHARLKDLGNEFTKEEVHEFLKAKFHFQELVNEDTGEVIQIPRSTTIMTKSRFAEYIGDIQRWAAQFLDIYLPDPGQQLDAFNEG